MTRIRIRGAGRAFSMCTPSPRVPGLTGPSTRRGNGFDETTFAAARLYPDRVDGGHQHRGHPAVARHPELHEVDRACQGDGAAPRPLHDALADRPVHAGQAEGAAVAG